MGAGLLRVYLGVASGVGMTYKMLEEGQRRLEGGTDVVIGFVETHGRGRTADLIEGIETIPPATVIREGAELAEMDLAAVLARRPDVALVDDLAHTNVPGSPHERRWQDIQELLDAGITVITTVDVQQLESLNDVVYEITGVRQRETVPDAVVRQAQQIELVDMTPEALRRQLVHGNVYTPEKVDAALGNYFRVGNLTALRELALLWVAGKVDEQLDKYRADHNIGSHWEAPERVVVALTGGPEGETLVRRAARIAAHTKGADLLAVHVRVVTASAAETPHIWPVNERWWKNSEAPTTRWSAPMSPTLCWHSLAASMPLSWCLERVDGDAGRRYFRRASASRQPLNPDRSMYTLSPTRRQHGRGRFSKAPTACREAVRVD